MANALFNALGGQPVNPLANLMEQVKQMQKTFNGNPKAEVERLIQTGQMSQEQFNQFSQIANQVMQMMK